MPDPRFGVLKTYYVLGAVLKYNFGALDSVLGPGLVDYRKDLNN